MSVTTNVLCCFVLVLTKVFETETTFANQNTAVIFNIPVPPKNHSMNDYNSTEFLPMLSRISSQFHQLGTVITDEVALNIPAVKQVPFAVATYSKFHLKTGELPLQLSVTFLLTNITNLTDSKRPSAWSLLTDKINIANLLYPGTVKRIYIEQSEIVSDINVDKEVEKFENYLASTTFPNNYKIELGVSLPLQYCQSEGLPRVLKSFRHISFYWWPNFGKHYNEMPQVAVQRLLKEYNECKQIIKGYGDDITIRIQTGWLCLNRTDGAEQAKKLVKYWKEVNDWAETSNTSVLFWEAFDVPEEYIETGLEHMGLWKLVPSASYKRISEYVFKEKGNIVPTCISSISWVLILIAILLVVIAGAIFSMIYMHHFHPTLFYSRVLPYIRDFNCLHF